MNRVNVVWTFEMLKNIFSMHVQLKPIQPTLANTN